MESGRLWHYSTVSDRGLHRQESRIIQENRVSHKTHESQSRPKKRKTIENRTVRLLRFGGVGGGSGGLGLAFGREPQRVLGGDRHADHDEKETDAENGIVARQKLRGIVLD